MWMGETPKNIVAVFRLARKDNAVLLFDEADAIASRRSSSLDHAFVRETNTVINVLLQELERFTGVVIFATNLAANFDPAFERRIRTHVLFEMPGARRARADLAGADAPADAARRRCRLSRPGRAQFEASGGDIRNAVLKAAQAAAAEPGTDAFKAIHQRHLADGMRDVLAGKNVMRQSLLDLKPLTTELDEELKRAQDRLTRRTLPLVTISSVLALLLALVALAVALLR